MSSRSSLSILPPFASVSLTLPMRFNPPPDQMQGELIPEEWLHECELYLIKQFGGVTITDGMGGSIYPDSTAPDKYVVYRGPERRYVVDLPLDKITNALEWFSLHCPLWAAQFQQVEIYLKISTPDGVSVVRFTPTNG